MNKIGVRSNTVPPTPIPLVPSYYFTLKNCFSLVGGHRAGHRFGRGGRH